MVSENFDFAYNNMYFREQILAAIDELEGFNPRNSLLITQDDKEDLYTMLKAIARVDAGAVIVLDEELDDDEGEWEDISDLGMVYVHYEGKAFDADREGKALRSAVRGKDADFVLFDHAVNPEKMRAELIDLAAVVDIGCVLVLTHNYLSGGEFEVDTPAYMVHESWSKETTLWAPLHAHPGRFFMYVRAPWVQPHRSEEIEGSIGHFFDQLDFVAPTDLAETLRPVKTVWVQRDASSPHPFISGVQFPLPEDVTPFHEPPFRGYVRGILVAVTPALGIVAVTHVCERMDRDTHPQTEPTEHVLTPPQLRAFDITFVNAWGPWHLGVETGPIVLQHIVPGPAEMWDEEVEMMATKDWLRLSTFAWWDSSPHAQSVWPVQANLVRSGFMMPTAGGMAPFDVNLLHIEHANGRARVLYQGALVGQITVPPNFRDIQVIEHDNGVQGFWRGIETGPPISLRPRTPPPQDWAVEGWRRFVDGSWVGDMHDAFHGVWQAADRASGPTAIAGLANATAGAALGVALAVARSNPPGRGEESPAAGLYWFPTRAFNFFTWVGAAVIGGVSTRFAAAIDPAGRYKPQLDAVDAVVLAGHSNRAAADHLQMPGGWPWAE